MSDKRRFMYHIYAAPGSIPWTWDGEILGTRVRNLVRCDMRYYTRKGAERGAKAFARNILRMESELLFEGGRTALCNK